MRSVSVVLLVAFLSACATATPQSSNPDVKSTRVSWHAAAALPGRDDELSLYNGDVVARPPENSTASFGSARGGRCSFHQYVPPPCGAAGAFRRFYTSAGAGYIAATWSPSSNASTLPTPIPTSNPPPVPAEGFLFVEGWPTVKLAGQSTEAGFQYDPAHNWFYLFEKPPGKKYWYADAHFAVAQLSVSLAAGTTCPAANVTCVVAAFGGTCYGTPTPCTASRSVSAPGWVSPACCVLASTIAIQEPAPGRAWTNGALFGPTDQSVCALVAASPAGCQAPGLVQAGQRFPNDRSRIVVREQIPGLTGTEIDTIDLHP
jgi:hypothetical protein